MRHSWKQREFVLSRNPSRLAYFKDPNTAGSAGAAGKVEFGGAHTVELQQVSGAKKTGKSGSTEWRFRVVSGGTRLLMAAESESEMQSWLSALSGLLGVPAVTVDGVGEAQLDGDDEGGVAVVRKRISVADSVQFENRMRTQTQPSPQARARAETRKATAVGGLVGAAVAEAAEEGEAGSQCT
jgi:uncharacterized protein YaiE (UPF0345 family)